MSESDDEMELPPPDVDLEEEMQKENDKKKKRIGERGKLPEIKREKKFEGYKNFKSLYVKHGDLTKSNSEALVNAANSLLLLAGGLALAFLKTAGTGIQNECLDHVKKNGHVKVGNNFVSSSGKLKENGVKVIIHSVGPNWKFKENRKGKIGEEEEDEKLISAIQNCLISASKLGMKSISLPAISTGVFGFPKERCAILMFETVLKYVKNDKNTSLETICFTNFDMKTVNIFCAQFDKEFHFECECECECECEFKTKTKKIKTKK